MTFGRVLGGPSGPLPVSQGGTGAASEQAARDNLKVPGLDTANAFTKNQALAGSLDMEGNLAVYGDILTEAGTLTVRGDLGNANIQLNKSGSIIFFDPASAPKLVALSANPTNTRLQSFPDASGTILVTSDSPAKGTILYHDGSVWKLLSPSAGVLTCDGSGNLSWA